MAKAKAPGPVLLWKGGAAPQFILSGVPARDFTEHQLNRLIYIRTVGQASGRDGGLYPGDKGFDAARQDLIDSLLFSGLYAVPE